MLSVRLGVWLAGQGHSCYLEQISEAAWDVVVRFPVHFSSRLKSTLVMWWGWGVENETACFQWQWIHVKSQKDVIKVTDVGWSMVRLIKLCWWVGWPRLWWCLQERPKLIVKLDQVECLCWILFKWKSMKWCHGGENVESLECIVKFDQCTASIWKFQFDKTI